MTSTPDCNGSENATHCLQEGPTSRESGMDEAAGSSRNQWGAGAGTRIASIGDRAGWTAVRQCAGDRFPLFFQAT